MKSNRIDLKLHLDLHIYLDWCLSCAILMCYLHFAVGFTCLDILSIANEATCISLVSQSSFPHDHRKQFCLKSTSLTLPRERESGGGGCKLGKVVMTRTPAQSQQYWIYMCWNEHISFRPCWRNYMWRENKEERERYKQSEATFGIEYYYNIQYCI